MIRKIKEYVLHLLCVVVLLGGMTACEGFNINFGGGNGTGTGNENGNDENVSELVNCWHLVTLYGAEVDADIYILAHATSPFIRPSTIEDAVARVESGEYDSAFSAERLQTFAWYEGQPLNYSLEKIPRTQDLEAVYIETSAFFIFRREVWRQMHRRIGERAYTAVTDRIESMDIDNPDDFLLAEAVVAAGLNK